MLNMIFSYRSPLLLDVVKILQEFLCLLITHWAENLKLETVVFFMFFRVLWNKKTNPQILSSSCGPHSDFCNSHSHSKACMGDHLRNASPHPTCNKSCQCFIFNNNWFLLPSKSNPNMYPILASDSLRICLEWMCSIFKNDAMDVWILKDDTKAKSSSSLLPLSNRALNLFRMAREPA